jgi:hypothetical protein
MQLDKNFWTNRYIENTTAWDLEDASPPIKKYIDQLSDKDAKILIPGCGRAYEGEYLHNKGFTNVYLLDYALPAFNDFLKRCPTFPKENLIAEDFFSHIDSYDIIVEQTFFCAINPALRTKYAEHCHKILKPKGKLTGLLFNDELNTDKPPFGGFKEEYELLFAKYFNFKTMETAYNSINPRANRELFIILEKKEITKETP